jgi:hypothetical protein
VLIGAAAAPGRLEYLQGVAGRPASHALRASDADREQVVTLLSDAVADGRLTPQEHADRIDAAYAARTLGELAPLTTDLLPAGAQPIQHHGRRLVTGIFGREYREGRWVVPERLAASAIFGEVTLDLTDAVLGARRVLLFATVIGGTLRLIVPDHVAVEVTGAAVLGRKGASSASRASRDGASRNGASRIEAGAATTERSGPPPGPGTPVIDVRAYALGGRVKVIRARPPRRLKLRRPAARPR